MFGLGWLLHGIPETRRCKPGRVIGAGQRQPVNLRQRESGARDRQLGWTENLLTDFGGLKAWQFLRIARRSSYAEREKKDSGCEGSRLLPSTETSKQSGDHQMNMSQAK
jgi:hypothetical protein